MSNTPGSTEAAPVKAALHTSPHAGLANVSPPLHSNAVPASEHQVSLVHASPSSHATSSRLWVHPPSVHASMEHGLSSSHSSSSSAYSHPLAPQLSVVQG